MDVEKERIKMAKVRAKRVVATQVERPNKTEHKSEKPLKRGAKSISQKDSFLTGGMPRKDIGSRGRMQGIGRFGTAASIAKKRLGSNGKPDPKRVAKMLMSRSFKEAGPILADIIKRGFVA